MGSWKGIDTIVVALIFYFRQQWHTISKPCLQIPIIGTISIYIIRRIATHGMEGLWSTSNNIWGFPTSDRPSTLIGMESHLWLSLTYIRESSLTKSCLQMIHYLKNNFYWPDHVIFDFNIFKSLISCYSKYMQDIGDGE